MIQYYQLFKIQEDQENNSINVLLDVGKDPKIPHGFMTPKEQRRVYKTADNPTKETSDLKSWKICEATRPHQLDYIPDDVFALQRQYHRSSRFLTGVPSLINLSKERKCGISENIGDNSTKKQKASIQADTSKSSTTQEGAYDFKSCPSTEGHIKRYRKEVTHKIMSDYMSVLLMESRTGEAVGKHGSYCCPHLLSVYKSKARQQKCITKASFICYNLNFEEQNGMKSELGCLRVGPVDSTCGCHKHALAQKSRGCSIPNITLPSMKEIVDFTAVSKLSLRKHS